MNLSYIALFLSAVSLVISGGMLMKSQEMAHAAHVGRILIYDEGAMPSQVAPFVQAGYNSDAIVDQAISLAYAQGYILVSSRQARGPANVSFKISNFIAVPDIPENAPKPVVPEELQQWQKSRDQIFQPSGTSEPQG